MNIQLLYLHVNVSFRNVHAEVKVLPVSVSQNKGVIISLCRIHKLLNTPLSTLLKRKCENDIGI